MLPSKWNRGLLLKVAFIAAICALMLYGLAVWTQYMADRQYIQQHTLRISTWLSSLYELYGDWNRVAEKLLSAERSEGRQTLLHVTGLEARIWSAGNELVWPRVSSSNPLTDSSGPLVYDKADRHILLMDGLVIGYFQVLQQANGKLSPFIWISLLFGLFILAILYFVFMTESAVWRSSLRRILNQLTAVTQTDYPKSADSVLVSAIETEISRIEQRLFRLETIRKSMVADVAHELRTPLSVMRSQLEQCLAKQLPIGVAGASVLQDEVHRMSKLLTDLQQLSLAESGHLRLNKSWFSLRNMIEELVDLFAVDMEERGIMIELQADGQFRIYADEARFKQILINLISNALRYARSSVMIQVSFQDSQCEVAIVDDGIGMEEEQIPAVFERFYRGTMQRRDASGSASSGLGLGLPIVKQLVELHGGTIRATSKWNEGSAFHIRFPIFHESTATA